MNSRCVWSVHKLLHAPLLQACSYISRPYIHGRQIWSLSDPIWIVMISAAGQKVCVVTLYHCAFTTRSQAHKHTNSLIDKLITSSCSSALQTHAAAAPAPRQQIPRPAQRAQAHASRRAQLSSVFQGNAISIAKQPYLRSPEHRPMHLAMRNRGQYSEVPPLAHQTPTVRFCSSCTMPAKTMRPFFKGAGSRSVPCAG